MFDFQRLYEEEVKKLISPEKLGLQLLEKRLNEIELYLIDNQRLELKEHFKNPQKDTIIFNLVGNNSPTLGSIQIALGNNLS